MARDKTDDDKAGAIFRASTTGSYPSRLFVEWNSDYLPEDIGMRGKTAGAFTITIRDDNWESMSITRKQAVEMARAVLRAAGEY